MTFVIGIVWVLGETSPLGKWARESISLPVLFGARTLLGRDPGLDPRIHVWAMGESSLGKLGHNDLTLDQWASLFEALAETHPKAIFIDKLFSQRPGTEREAANFRKRLARLGTPVIVGAHVISRSVEGRIPLPWDHPALQLSRWNAELKTPPGVPRRDGGVFGPHPDLLDAFPQVGHLMVLPGGYVEPLLRLNEANILAFAPWFIADRAEVQANQLKLNGHSVPIDGDGKTLVNLSPPTTYRPRLESLGDLVAELGRKKPLSLPAGSVVVLLTSYAAGERSYLSTPQGPTVPAHIHLALIQSVLSGRWVSTFPGGQWLALLFAALGLLICRGKRRNLNWGLAGLTVAALIVAGITTFAFVDKTLPWLCWLGAFVGSFGVEQALDWKRRTDSYRALIDRFEGLLPSDKLKALSEAEGRSWLQPRTQVVTVIFIDIVGFSSIAEKVPPDEVFALLRGLFQDIATIVHRYGGVIDKTLGDGLLAYFGLGKPADNLEGTHADWALACAREIQMANAERVAATSPGAPVFPFRLGINSSAVVLGDLGGFRRVDFTLIGHGVNLAKRFEAACEPFRILMGVTTASLLTLPEHLRLRIPSRWIPIKNQDDPVEARELDPLAGMEDLENRARTAYRNFARLERIDARQAAIPGALWLRSPALGDAELTNFSRGGFSFKAKKYLGRGCLLTVTLHAGSAESAPLTEHPVLGSIRWGREIEPGVFLHGVKFENLNPGQREELLANLMGASAPPSLSLRPKKAKAR